MTKEMFNKTNETTQKKTELGTLQHFITIEGKKEKFSKKGKIK